MFAGVRGKDLCRAVCDQDLEGIVAKLANGQSAPSRRHRHEEAVA
jgi:hypothetical protein